MAEKKKSKELVKVEPSRPLSPFEEAERRFEDFFRRPFSLFGPSWLQRLKMPDFEETTPSVDIFEEGADMVMKAELPGMKKEEIEVNVSGNMLTISGEKKREEKVEKKNYYRLERSYGSFSRSFTLPSGVQADKIKAQFKDGILEVRIPKTEEVRKKEIKVSVG